MNRCSVSALPTGSLLLNQKNAVFYLAVLLSKKLN